MTPNQNESTRLTGELAPLLSMTALERLRRMAREAGGPQDSLDRDDLGLLTDVGLLDEQGMAREALLLVGSEEGLRQYFPNYRWTYQFHWVEPRKADHFESADALPLALQHLSNSIQSGASAFTMQTSAGAFEYRPYPAGALREVLLNAFCHADYTQETPIQVSQEADRVEICNPGSLPDGISPNNLLRRRSALSNPLLAEALARLGLSRRTESGMQCIFRELLSNGSQPPAFDFQNEQVKVTIAGGATSARFRCFVEQEAQDGRSLSLEHLLALHAVLHQPEIDLAAAALVCQLDEPKALDILEELESEERGYIQRIRNGQEITWALRPAMYTRLSDPRWLQRQRFRHWEILKKRVVDVIKQRSVDGGQGISNAEIRQLTLLRANHVRAFVKELTSENPQIELVYRGRLSTYRWRE
ncbi:MAG TPA: ATP-binding protein [Anaerolineales bacterium]|nr:ATP-binding protein [Anaerolineales bacterium]